MDRATLEESGIDYASGLRRFMGDCELYEAMLAAFPADDSFSRASDAFGEGNYKALYELAHTLKGASGNLDLTELYLASGELAEYLRRPEAPQEAAVSDLFDKLRAAYGRVVEGIRAASK